MKEGFFAAFVLLFAMVACDKPQINPIPNWQVDFTIDVRFADDDLFLSPSAKIITEPRFETDRLGFAGLILTRDVLGDLHAFDRACPFEAERITVLELDGIFAKCSKCGSVFDLTNGFGNRISGPSEFDLKRYTVVFSSNLQYKVYNKDFRY